MKILIAGNSQVAPLMQAYWRAPQILNSLGEIYFYAINGGEGPLLTVQSEKLKVDTTNPNPPIFVHPPRTDELALTVYDVVVVCALGYIDGGVTYWDMTITRQGAIFEFLPKENTLTDRLLSRTCYEQILYDMLGRQAGFRFLKVLRSEFSGRIILQPFPLLSSAIAPDPRWPINQIYRKPLEAHAFFQSTRDRFLEEICGDSVELLSYPCEEWTKTYFTPEPLMRTTDGVHMNEVYAEMVLNQLSRQIREGTARC